MDRQQWYAHDLVSIGQRLVPTVGFEPTTCCLRNSCSTTELRWPVIYLSNGPNDWKRPLYRHLLHIPYRLPQQLRRHRAEYPGVACCVEAERRTWVRGEAVTLAQQLAHAARHRPRGVVHPH